GVSERAESAVCFSRTKSLTMQSEEILEKNKRPENPKVSVAMSVHNGERFLAEATDSILGQTFRDFELILVDDGSTDGSGAIADAYQRKDTRVRVIHQHKFGLVAALNQACEQARGEYIARMDADDVAIPDRLVRQVAFMDAHPEVAVLGGT